MDLKDFGAAYDALPEGAANDDIVDFLAAVAVSYMPPGDAIKALFMAARRVAQYAQDVGDEPDTDCDCPRCAARRAAQVKH